LNCFGKNFNENYGDLTIELKNMSDKINFIARKNFSETKDSNLFSKDENSKVYNTQMKLRNDIINFNNELNFNMNDSLQRLKKELLNELSNEIKV